MTRKTITASVGESGANRRADVETVQTLLNVAPPGWGGPSPKLAVDGKSGTKTVAAIRRFQEHHFKGWFPPDGRVEPKGNTLFRLNHVAIHPEKPGAFFRIDVPDVNLLGGPNGVCWALVATMLASKRDGVCYEVEEVLRRADAKAGRPGFYIDRYRKIDGLKPTELPMFVWACGFTYEPRANYPISHWMKLLGECGPLAAVGTFPLPHVKLIVGAYGDGTLFGTVAVVHDPIGKKYEELFIDILEGYENMGGNPWIDDLAQLWYCRVRKPRLPGGPSRRLPGGRIPLPRIR